MLCALEGRQFAEFMCVILQPPSSFLFPHLITHRLISLPALFYLINLKAFLRCISSMKASLRITCLNTSPVFELPLPWFFCALPFMNQVWFRAGPFNQTAHIHNLLHSRVLSAWETSSFPCLWGMKERVSPSQGKD